MRLIKLRTALIFVSFVVTQNFGAPADSTNSLVVWSSETTRAKRSQKERAIPDVDLTEPQIYRMEVKSKISNRFAHTTVISKVINLAEEAQEVTFSTILPETAYISGLVMTVYGKNYTAFVKEKEEAQRTYAQAVTSGLRAAHVAVTARDSNRFTVSVNVEAETTAVFYLSYEELLKRNDGHYELVINLHPGQPVKYLSVEVVIAENKKITDLKAPPIRSGNEIGNNNAELDPRADIKILNDTAAMVKFTPNLERQKQLAHLLGTNESKGLAGQFVVQYDVERDPKGGEILKNDGYCVHFFAPSQLPLFPKHIVFVLDTSGSMRGTKIKQLKEAMHKILEQLHEEDFFSLVEFSSNVKVLNLNNPDSTANVYSVNADNIRRAKAIVIQFRASGGTNIHGALEAALNVVEQEKKPSSDIVNHTPIIVFLTDGEPTVGVTSTAEIILKITKYNVDRKKVPIIALSLGDGADKNFLHELASLNFGFAKQIYEGADVSLQLQGFYKQISTPLLAHVTFKYDSSFTSLTNTKFPLHFNGSELVVAGRCEERDDWLPAVDALNGHGSVSFQPTVKQSDSNIERLWAYLTVKQSLDKKDTADGDKENLERKALDLSLKYSFVTSVTSLVVVKPDDINAVNTVPADGTQPQYAPNNPSTVNSKTQESGGPESTKETGMEELKLMMVQLMTGVQQIKEEQRGYREEIRKLKSENNGLRRRISTLEAKVQELEKNQQITW